MQLVMVVRIPPRQQKQPVQNKIPLLQVSQILKNPPPLLTMIAEVEIIKQGQQQGLLLTQIVQKQIQYLQIIRLHPLHEVKVRGRGEMILCKEQTQHHLV